MPSYRAEFFSADEYASRQFEADAPGEALRLARQFFDERGEELEFQRAEERGIDQIQIYDPEQGTLADWKSPDYLAREAAPELLGATEDFLSVLDDLQNAIQRQSLNDVREIFFGEAMTAAMERAHAATAQATGEPEPGSNPEPDEHTLQTARVVEAPEHLHYLVTALEAAIPIVGAGATGGPTPEDQLAQEYQRAEVTMIEQPAHRQPAALQSPDEEALHRRTLFLVEGLLIMDRLREMPAAIQQEAMELAQGYRNLLAMPSIGADLSVTDDVELASAIYGGTPTAPAAEPAIADQPDAWHAQLERIADEAAKGGHGLFYELYAQDFSDRVDAWIRGLPEGQREAAQEIAAAHGDYFGDHPGRWVYDHEENDIRLIGGDDHSTPEQDARAGAEPDTGPDMG